MRHPGTCIIDGDVICFTILPCAADSRQQSLCIAKPLQTQPSCLHLQVGDKLYVQLPGAAGIIASPVVAIENVIEHSAFNLQTLRGGKDSYQYRL